MTIARLYLLLALLKAYRGALTWTLPGGNRDTYRVNADTVIRDVRFAIANGGFYRQAERQVIDLHALHWADNKAEAA